MISVLSEFEGFSGGEFVEICESGVGFELGSPISSGSKSFSSVRSIFGGEFESWSVDKFISMLEIDSDEFCGLVSGDAGFLGVPTFEPFGL